MNKCCVDVQHLSLLFQARVSPENFTGIVNQL